MGFAGKAIVAIWNDIAPEMREDFFEWHPREHMVERLGIPGFLRGRRYSAIDANVEFLTMYEVADPGVLLGNTYKERVTNPSPWSAKTLPFFRNNVRGGFRIHFTEGYAMGAYLHTVRLRAPEGQDAALVEALKREVMPGFVDQPRITGAHVLENDVALTAGNAGMQRGRVIALPNIAIFIEGSTADGVRAACAKRLASDRLRGLGAVEEALHHGLYQLEYSIQNLAPG